MFTRRLGRCGITVSAMGMGCWAIGGPWMFDDAQAGWGTVDDNESIRAIHCALDSGINLFDTAANYGCGHSEQVLGLAIKKRRDRVILATKFGYLVDVLKKRVTHSSDVVKSIRHDCEASLRRLQTDYIDLYQFHDDDYPAKQAELVRDELDALVAEGKIRWYGWSTDYPERAEIFARGKHCTAIQHELNMMYEPPGILDTCAKHDQASIIRSPFGGGFQTGKLTSDSTFPENDRRHGWDLHLPKRVERLKKLDAVRAALAGDGRTLCQIALGWIWARSDRTIPIPGFRTVDQVRENIQAMEFGPLNSEQMMTIQEIMHHQDQ